MKKPSRENKNHVYDVLHFVCRAREVRLVTPAWYDGKFHTKPGVKRSKKTGNRQWTRFKQTIRALGIPYETVEDPEAMNGTSAIKFVLPDAWERINLILAEGDKDESGKHREGCGADSGDPALLGEGPERHGHLPLRTMDAR